MEIVVWVELPHEVDGWDWGPNEPEVLATIFVLRPDASGYRVVDYVGGESHRSMELSSIDEVRAVPIASACEDSLWVDHSVYYALDDTLVSATTIFRLVDDRLRAVITCTKHLEEYRNGDDELPTFEVEASIEIDEGSYPRQIRVERHEAESETGRTTSRRALFAADGSPLSGDPEVCRVGADDEP
jgi:hypothetical protein